MAHLSTPGSHLFMRQIKGKIQRLREKGVDDNDNDNIELSFSSTLEKEKKVKTTFQNSLSLLLPSFGDFDLFFLLFSFVLYM